MTAPEVRLGGGDHELMVDLARLGARITSIRMAMPDGSRREVTAGLVGDDDFRASDHYQGASVGRVANRIAGGDLPLDGVHHQLATNDRGHTLHGGPDGFSMREWAVVEHRDRRAVLELVSPDGDQGFPGTVRVRATFEVSGPALRIAYAATTDRPTVVSLTSHSYFRLTDTVAGHRVRVAADRYLPTDDTDIPTGVADVAGTAYDLRTPTGVDPGFDHCWVLAGVGMRPVAELEGGGLVVTVVTDQPGLQLYAGGGIVDGIALEPQHLPDSVHHPDWPSTRLEPGESYQWRSEFHVSGRP